MKPNMIGNTPREQTETKLEERIFMPTGRGDIFDLTPGRLDEFKGAIQDIFNGSRGVLIFFDNYKLNENGVWAKDNDQLLSFQDIAPIESQESYGIRLRFKIMTPPPITSEYDVPIYMGQEPRFAFLMRKGGHSLAEPRFGLYLSQAYTENIPNRWLAKRQELIFL